MRRRAEERLEVADTGEETEQRETTSLEEGGRLLGIVIRSSFPLEKRGTKHWLNNHQFSCNVFCVQWQ